MKKRELDDLIRGYEVKINMLTAERDRLKADLAAREIGVTRGKVSVAELCEALVIAMGGKTR